MFVFFKNLLYTNLEFLQMHKLKQWLTITKMQCKCTHRVMRRCVPENETAFSIEEQQAVRFRESCSLGREETLVRAQGGDGEDE